MKKIFLILLLPFISLPAFAAQTKVLASCTSKDPAVKCSVTITDAYSKMTIQSQFPILIEVTGCSLDSPQEFIGLTYSIAVNSFGERYLDFISTIINLYSKPADELSEETDLNLKIGNVAWMNMTAHQVRLSGKRTNLNCSILKSEQ